MSVLGKGAIITSGHYWVRQFRPAESTQRMCVWRIAVVEGYVVVGTLLVWLHFEHHEHQLDSVAGRRREMPDAVFSARIIIGIVGAGYLAHRGGDFVFTTALFAVSLIFVQSEAVVAGANVGTQGVYAFVLAAAIVYRTFVHICNINIKLWFRPKTGST